MKAAIGIISLFIWSNFANASVQQEMTLLNIGTSISSTLTQFHSACNAITESNGNKVLGNRIDNQPKPIAINIPKRSTLDNEIKPIHVAQPKREVSNEIKPIYIAQPKSNSVNQLINCHQYQKQLATKLFSKTQNLIERNGQNISEYSEMMDFVDQLVSNMLLEQQNTAGLSNLLNTKRLYKGLELAQLITENGFVIPVHIFNINTFVDHYTDSDFK